MKSLFLFMLMTPLCSFAADLDGRWRLQRIECREGALGVLGQSKQDLIASGKADEFYDIGGGKIISELRERGKVGAKGHCKTTYAGPFETKNGAIKKSTWKRQERAGVDGDKCYTPDPMPKEQTADRDWPYELKSGLLKIAHQDAVVTNVNKKKLHLCESGSDALFVYEKVRPQLDFAALETKAGGPLGVFALETVSGRALSNRPDERFLMCSTFKLLLCAHVLKRVDEKKETLDRAIPVSKKDLMEYAPVTSKRAGQTMTLEELCAAAVQDSDNTAANLLLATQGGPKGLTDFIRATGDQVTRHDRTEPALNDRGRGAEKDFDTTTPAAMVKTLQSLFLGETLSPASRDHLKTWALGTKTGATRLKAGLPAGWTLADKTGSGRAGGTNDIGVIYPKDGAPIVIAVFIAESTATKEDREAAIADVARKVAVELGPTP